jgi:hypothetical protein
MDKALDSPASVQLLHVIAEQMDLHYEIFKIHSSKYLKLRDAIKVDRSFDGVFGDLEKSDSLVYLQLLMLLVLSMHGGVFMPHVKTITEMKDGIKISWQEAVHHRLRFGYYDEGFVKFVQYFRRKILIGGGRSKKVDTAFLKELYDCLTVYIGELDNVEKKISKIIKKKSDFISVLGNNETQDLLFILLSCLPREEMNSLFLYVQQFLPEDLDVKVQDKSYNVTKLFDTPAADMKVLMKKSLVYFDLYFSVRLPILQHITQTKTKEFLKDLVKNTEVVAAISKNLETLKASQIDIRLSIYKFFYKHLKSFY